MNPEANLLPPVSRRTVLLLAVLAFLAVLVIWQIPDLSALVYPFRFFVTTVHELSHGLSAILTGGQFLEYTVESNGAGLARSAGGTRWIIIQAGYLGAAFTGAALIFLANRFPNRARWIAWGLGLLLSLTTVLFARNLVAVVAGALSAAGLLLLGWKGARLLVLFVLNFLGMLLGLNALLDIWGLLQSLNSATVLQLGNVPNDAYNMAETVGILPAAGWALLWMLLSLGMLAFALYLSFWRPLRHSVNRAAGDV